MKWKQSKLLIKPEMFSNVKLDIEGITRWFSLPMRYFWQRKLEGYIKFTYMSSHVMHPLSDYKLLCKYNGKTIITESLYASSFCTRTMCHVIWCLHYWHANHACLKIIDNDTLHFKLPHVIGVVDHICLFQNNFKSRMLQVSNIM